MNLSVPQGSILGPLLFTLMTFLIVKYGTSSSFADNTSIFISGKTTQMVFDIGLVALSSILSSRDT